MKVISRHAARNSIREEVILGRTKHHSRLPDFIGDYGDILFWKDTIRFYITLANVSNIFFHTVY